MKLITSLSAQKNTHEIKLSPERLNVDFGFNIGEVIDKRIIKTNIGFAQKGMANRRVKAVLPDSLPLYLLTTLEALLPRCEDCTELVLIVHEFNVAEQTNAMSEMGSFRIQVEFAKRKEGILYSIFFIETQIEEKAMDVTKGHSKRIIDGLKYCLVEFSKLDWENIQGEIVDFDEEITFDFKRIPKAGLYSSFSKMCRDEPFKTKGYKVDIAEDRYPKYYIKDQEGKQIKNRVMGFSDGEHIYISASRYSYESHYVKSKQIGKYIYFEDRFTDPMVGLMFGLLGSALSNTPKALLLDTTTGLIIKLDEIGIELFLEDYPTIKSEYMSSRRKMKDKFEAITKVNDKFN